MPNDRPKVGLACIAKDEDRYILECILYHREIGIEDIYVYQNDWRWRPSYWESQPSWLHLREWDGTAAQIPAMNHAISTVDGVDWLCLLDCDEFLTVPGYADVGGLCRGHESDAAIVLNWRLFGSTETPEVDDGQPGVLHRFLKREAGFNHHVKSIVNLHKRCHISNPHCVDRRFLAVTPEGCPVRGPFNPEHPSRTAWIAHFYCKSWPEYRNRRCGTLRSDTGTRYDNGEDIAAMRKAFDEHNKKDVRDTSLRDVLYRPGEAR